MSSYENEIEEGQGWRSRSDLTSRDTSAATIGLKSRQSSDKRKDDFDFDFDFEEKEKEPEKEELELEKEKEPELEPEKEKDMFASASKTPEESLSIEDCNFEKVDLADTEPLSDELFEIFSQEKEETGSYANKSKNNRLPQQIVEFTEAFLFQYTAELGIACYLDMEKVNDNVLTLYYNCLGDEAVSQLKSFSESELNDALQEALGEVKEIGGRRKGKGKTNGKKTRKRGGMPGFKSKIGRAINATIKFLGATFRYLIDFLIFVMVVGSFYVAWLCFIKSYNTMKPIRSDVIEPLKAQLLNPDYKEIMMSPEEQLILYNNQESLSIYTDNPINTQTHVKNVLSHVGMVVLNGIVTHLGGSSEILQYAAIIDLGFNEGSLIMDKIARSGTEQVFSDCFYDVSPDSAIDMATKSLTFIHNKEQKKLIQVMIDSQKEKLLELKTQLPPSPDELSAESSAKSSEPASAEVNTDGVVVTEESVGFWSSISSGVGSAWKGTKGAATAVSSKVGSVIDTAVSKVSKTVNSAAEIASVVMTSKERAECSQRVLSELIEEQKRDFQTYLSAIRKESNKALTAFSYSRRFAFFGLALLVCGRRWAMLFKSRIRGRAESKEKAAQEARVQSLEQTVGNLASRSRMGENLALTGENLALTGENLAIMDNLGNANSASAAVVAPRSNALGFPVVSTVRSTSTGRRRQQQQEQQEEMGGGKRKRKRTRKIRKRQTKKRRKNGKKNDSRKRRRRQTRR